MATPGYTKGYTVTEKIRTRGSAPRGTVVAKLLWAFAVSWVVWGNAGCYDPKVSPGGLRCASLPAKECPDGFACANGVCVTEGGGGGGSGGTGGSGGVGSGGAGGTCASPITPLCSNGPVAPAVCDTVCQTGCPCGLRCSVTTAGVGCAAPIGTRPTGDVCNPNADQCATGLVCLRESCGTDLGRCYRYCSDAVSPSVCGTGVCGRPVDLPNGGSTDQRACNLGDYSCDAFLGTNCPNPAFTCYVTAPGHATCDCPSGMNGQVGDTCMDYNDCVPGLACLRVGVVTSCHRLCRNTTDCADCSMTPGTAVGYCP